MSVRFLASAMLCLILSIAGLSVLDKAKPPATPNDRRDFEVAFGEFKQVLSELYALQARYDAANPTEKRELESKSVDYAGKGEAIVPRLIAAAEIAYRSGHDEDARAGEFLFALVGDAAANDRYDEVTRLATLLREGTYRPSGLDNLSGIAAFCKNDFEMAKTELTQAATNEALDKIGEKYVALVDDYARFWKTEQTIRAAEARADDLPRVKITTTKGDIVVELFENEAPIATTNFIYLVEKQFYDNTSFHRVISNFMAQGGDPDGDGKGGPGYTIPCECYRPDHRRHFAGSLSMAHAGRDTAGSQFFLTFVPTDQLNGFHTVFGCVIEGMQVLARLERTEPRRPRAQDKIVRAVVLRKRDHEYNPASVPIR